MTTTAHEDTQGRHGALDERVRAAWAAYRDALKDLDSERYAATEPIAWEILQHELREISAARDTIETLAALVPDDR
jgi:hypothetical protein